MASMREYCELMSTSQLQSLLREEYEGRGTLPVDTILIICDILARRDPQLPSVKDSLRSLCHAYLKS